MTLSLFDENGQPIRVSSRIGKGGEGEVYLVDGSDQVVKFYTIQDLRTRELKIRHMLSNDLATKFPLIAFPRSIIFDRAHRFAGFTMAKVSAHKPLHELYSPGARKSNFPQANYRFLVLAAANIARAVGSANAAGCVIGDINHSGILVSPKATITLIDADSFQVSNGGSLLHCLVGVPDYTPPELQGKALSSIARTENHDAFGLAIAIFLLLFMGRHPFSGRYSGGDLPLEKAISEFRFAYSTKRSVGMSLPPGVPTLRDFPPAIGEAFEAAFGPSGPQNRPTPQQWMALLDSLKDTLKVCSKNTLHQYPSIAMECPWCRMEERFLVPLFLPHISDVDAIAAHGPVIGNIVTIWQAIEVVRPPAIRPFPVYSGPTPPPSAEAKKIRQERLAKKIAGSACILVALGIAIYASVLLSLVFAGIGWRLLVSKTTANLELEKKYKSIQARIYQAEIDWDRSNASNEFVELKSELQRKKSEHDGLPQTLKSRLDEYSRNRRAFQLTQYLNQQLIRNYKIRKIGGGRQAMLLSYGIETAADVNEKAILAVPGFGPGMAQHLLNWRRHLESRFVYNSAQMPADKSAVAMIRAEISQRGAKLQAELAMGPAKLTQIALAIPNKQAMNVPFIEMLLKQRAQVAADFETLGASIPNVDRPATKPRPSVIQPQLTQTAQYLTANARKCPKCGGHMVIRIARRGLNRGNKFYGCIRYPTCNGTRPFP
jgi:DNA-binding helix-hairpin-helix protein with protein kinase domain